MHHTCSEHDAPSEGPVGEEGVGEGRVVGDPVVGDEVVPVVGEAVVPLPVLPAGARVPSWARSAVHSASVVAVRQAGAAITQASASSAHSVQPRAAKKL